MSTVYLIPCTIAENATSTVPIYILDAVKQCQVFFVENERTARRYLKSLWKEMVIDDYEWVVIHKSEKEVKNKFLGILRNGKNIGIISEAGVPGVADPGQVLIAAAHSENFAVKPLVGPNSILLALMAGGLNGQQFQFIGYLPIDNAEKTKVIKQLESESSKKNCTQLFIETPYRNNSVLETLTKTLQPGTLLSIAADLTAETEYIATKKISDWKTQLPDLHKRPVIFSFLAAPIALQGRE
ncbi:MAG: SAM-dependent methyltransferase [Flavitalea sp.]